MKRFYSNSLLSLLRFRRRSDYLHVGLLLSICVHATLLAIQFNNARAPRNPPEDVLEVALVNARTTEAPAQPNILAQQNLNAGGNADSGVASSPLPHTAVQSPDQIVLEALQKRQEELEAEQLRLLTQLESTRAVPPDRLSGQTPDASDEAGPDDDSQDSLVLNAQISALKERIERYNKRPRQHFVGPSAKAVDYAEYVENWRARIELLGTEHYPDEARGKIYGKLQLTVYIKKNGELARIEINKPSEHAVLNLAAQRIVQLAAPFAPLPPAMAKSTDILAITRTWHFIDNQLSTQSP